MSVKKQWLGLFVLAAVHLPLWSSAWARKLSHQKFRPSECRQSDLAKKDCHFVRGQTRLQVWNDKLFLKTQVGRDLEALPIQADAVEWGFVQIKEFGARAWLSLGIWGPPGEGEVESLTWTLYEIVGQRLDKKLEKIIHRRKKTSDGVYKYDKAIAHKVFMKGNKVRWSVGREEGGLD